MDTVVALTFDEDQSLVHINYVGALKVLSFNYKKKELNLKYKKSPAAYCRGAFTLYYIMFACL